MTQIEHSWKSRLGVLCLSGLLLAPSAPSALAAEAPQVSLRFGMYSSYERVAFDWPSRVDYTIVREADHLTIRFAQVGRFADGVLRRGKKQRAQPAAAPGQNGDSYTLIVAPTAQIKDFRNRNAIVLDISGPLLDVAASQPVSVSAAVAPSTKPVATPASEIAPIVLGPLVTSAASVPVAAEPSAEKTAEPARSGY
nr:hypothetical protein [Alphaproteobacteria bacterium]